MKTGKIRIINNKVSFEPDKGKQLIEVSNEISYYHKEYYIHNVKGLPFIGSANVQNIKNNAHCKALIIKNEATIVELIKQEYS